MSFRPPFLTPPTTPLRERDRGPDLVVVVHEGERRPDARQWVAQSSVSIVVSVLDGHLDALRALLKEIAADVAGNRVIPFGRVEGVHFARLFVTDAIQSPQGSQISAHLVFMSDFDGGVAAHLERLVAVGDDGVDRVFGHCGGYPAARPVTTTGRLAYLRAHAVTIGANYVNTIGRTVEQVREEAALREAIENQLDSVHRDVAGSDAHVVAQSIRDFVSARPDLHWALSAAPRAPLPHRLQEAARFGLALLVAIILLPILLPAALVWLVAVRVHEARDPMDHARPSTTHLAELRALEDHAAQNQFTALGFVKPGWFRAATTRVILLLTGFGARHIFNSGNLAGVKTIHFARWVPLDGRARIIFCSNFDGSTESYMDDFIDKVAWGLNAIFSNGLGYPSTRWLIFGGARNEQAFKAFLRVHQVPTQVWFAAYDRLTALNIGINARIRAGLSSEMSERQVRAWLRLL